MDIRKRAVSRWFLVLHACLAGCTVGQSVVGGGAVDAGDGAVNDLVDAPDDVAVDAPDVVVARDVMSLCNRDDDCRGAAGGPVCDVMTGRCVQCVPSADTCPAGQFCNPATNACAAGCRDDDGCAAIAAADGGVSDAGDASSATGGHCDVANRRCVACLRDEHCPAGTLCRGNVCAMGCTAARACPTGEMCCTGACVDTRVNVESCGACTTRCTAVNGEAACRDSACAVARCIDPFADCDGMAANGCETDTRSASQHCGACGNACADRANGSNVCTAGRCQLTCNPGFADCDGDASNGCEVNTATSLDHCGMCNQRCAPANATGACTAGRCSVAACATGFLDCDTLVTNGCEVNGATDLANCGLCNRICRANPNTTPTCTAGACAAPCSTGFADCDANSNNGCEADTRVDANHCGSCTTACGVTNGVGACVASRCTVASCTTGFGDCDANAGTGCETALLTSNTHCGMCGRACASGSTCRNGACERNIAAVGCGPDDGGSGAAGTTNVLSRFCALTGPIGVLTGSLGVSGSGAGSLTIPTTSLPAGARLVRAALYRQTYNRTTTYLTLWSLNGRALNPTTGTNVTRRVAVSSSGSPFEVQRADITDVVRPLFPGVGSSISLPIAQIPGDSDGGFGWWLVYAQDSLPDRTIVVYDGGHTDVMAGHGELTLNGFTVGARPITARITTFGGGDAASDPATTATVTGSAGAVTLNDVTDPNGGPLVGTQSIDASSIFAPGNTTASLAFSLRNYSGVSWVIVDVNAAATVAATF